MNVTRGGILYLQSMSLSTRINGIVAVCGYAEMILRIEVHHEGSNRAFPLHEDGVNLLKRNDIVEVWMTYDTDGDGNWDDTESHIWVAL